MDPQIRTLVDISDTPAARRSTAEIVLERARWASETFRRYGREDTQRIVDAVAEAAEEKAAFYAEWAVRETGFGVVEHKTIKNRLTSKPLADHYRSWDFVNPRIDADRRIVELPRPAGVVFALTPSTNPIATVNFKTLISLMTRNAVVLSPHPAARECCVHAARYLASVAEEAGAPEAAIQVVERPTIPLIEEYMRSDKTDVILATGGNAMVRAAYSSSNPAIGVGPGNAPVVVDDTADLRKAAERIVESKSFDNSILCTNESVLIAVESIAGSLARELEKAGAHICSEDECDLLRRYLFHERGFNVESVGRDAAWVAAEAGFKVPPKTRILVAPIQTIGFGEKLSREKLCPVLGYYVARTIKDAIAQARALLRSSGAGHSAAIHSRNAQTILDFGSTVEAYRVVVNAPCSQGAAGYGTYLAPSFTVGTGYFGRSSIGENIGPQHLVHWTRIAHSSEPGEAMAAFETARMHLQGPLPKAPSDGVPGETRREPLGAPSSPRRRDDDAMREEIRRIIVEELRAALKE